MSKRRFRNSKKILWRRSRRFETSLLKRTNFKLLLKKYSMKNKNYKSNMSWLSVKETFLVLSSFEEVQRLISFMKRSKLTNQPLKRDKLNITKSKTYLI